MDIYLSMTILRISSYQTSLRLTYHVLRLQPVGPGADCGLQAGIRLPVRGQQDSIWLNGLGLAKGAYSLSNKNGKTSSSFSKLPPSVLFVERAALVEHMISEIKRLQPERWGCLWPSKPVITYAWLHFPILTCAAS